jgi:hypothetical protein
MKLAAAVLLPLTLTGLAPAGGPPMAPAPTDAVRQFRRDRGLVLALADGGLRLAGESDALKRARTCGGLVERLAGEIHTAAADGDAARALELAKHLQALLIQGVAVNAEQARKELPPGSPREAELQLLGEETARSTGLAEKGLAQLSGPTHGKQAQPLLAALRQGQAAVASAIAGKATPRPKGPAAKRPGGPQS